MRFIFFLLLLGAVFACKAQHPILPLDTRGTVPDGTYFKDVNNDLEKFVGTWYYQNNNISFTLKFKEQEQQFTGTWYRDRLVGDYKYELNGSEIVNYLPRLNSPFVTAGQHAMDGSEVVKSHYVRYDDCDDCATSEWRFILDFSDFDRKYLRSEILLKYINDNGVEKIRVTIYNSATVFLPYDGAPTEPRVPYGTYVLTKL